MLLAIDLGNTHIKLGMLDGTELRHTFRLPTQPQLELSDYVMALRERCNQAGIVAAAVTGAILASVVPELDVPLIAAVRAAFGCDCLVANTELDTGMVFRVDEPRAVGVDRWVNLVLLRERGLAEAGTERADAELARGSIVVDFGTATTLDCLSPRGEFVGGAIAPGARICLEALASRTAQLPRVPLAAPAHVVGRNTIEAMQSGIVQGHASLIDGLVAKMQAELGFPCHVVATGGLAPLIAPHARVIERVEPDLTLHALGALYARNVGRARSSS